MWPSGGFGDVGPLFALRLHFRQNAYTETVPDRPIPMRN